MSNRPHPPGPPPGQQQVACLQCASEHKAALAAAEAAGDIKPAELPPIRLADTWAPMPIPGAGVCAVPTCFGHLAVAKVPSLLAANGTPPPGLLRGRG